LREVTRILSAAESGDPQAAEKLLPLVYDELRRLAAAQLARENPGLTLSATALVHEAYLRLIGSPQTSLQYANRRHFFAAAAEAMRRILIENARRRKRQKRGAHWGRVELSELHGLVTPPNDDILLVDEALQALERVDADAACIVKLHFFAGLPLAEAAQILGIAERTAYRDWAFARAWLARFLKEQSGPDEDS
jgi:RNA polymerase sigma factor (TIGR02999 family)